jgi:hypothetical protein
VGWSRGMGKRKQSDRHPSITPAPFGAGQPPGLFPDEFSVAAYREGRSWLEATAVPLTRAHLSGNRAPRGVDTVPNTKLPLSLHRPSIEAHWQARFGNAPYTRQQRREIVEITEFSYEDLLQPSVYAPLYAELESDDRQRMIVRTFLKEALASFIRAGLGPANTLGSRPFQYRRPRTIPLQKSKRQAAVDEIERLTTECHAVEIAPEHDGDKALTASAEAWERRPLPNGNWPRERRIPIVTSWTEQQAYDRRCVADMMARRVQGKPYRDLSRQYSRSTKRWRPSPMHGLSPSKPFSGEAPF